MPRYSIRPIEAGDAPAMAEVIREVMTEYGAVGEGFSIEDPEVADMYEAYRSERRAYFVLLDEGKVVGGSGIAPLVGAAEEICELRKMYFLPSARGSGQGRRMMELCLGVAAEMGFRRCYLETCASMHEAQQLYSRFGFRSLPAPEGATGHFGCDRWYMRELHHSLGRRS